MAEKKIGVLSLFTVAFLITGQMVGAGILGIPVIVGIAGLGPALLIMAVYALAMYFSSVVLGREAVDNASESFSFPSLYGQYLGRGGKWVAIVVNMLMLYGLLTAYVAGGAEVIGRLLKLGHSQTLILIAFFVLVTTITLLGVGIVRRFNALLILLMWSSFITLLIIGERHIHPGYYTAKDWVFVPVTTAIIVTSFNFSNLIPVVCKSLDWNMKRVAVAMFIGLCVAFAMNTAWIIVGIGVLPLQGDISLVSAYIHNVPATVPMAEVIHSKFFLTCSLIFSVIAIITSYIGNGLGLMNFNEDLSVNMLKKDSKTFVAVITFLPPLIVTLIYPDIFIKALNVTGGICTITLFGIFPSVIAFIKYRKNVKVRLLAVVVFLVFLFGLVYQLGHQAGLFDIKPPKGSCLPVAYPPNHKK